MTIPQDLSYTPQHEWLRLDGDVATVGITDYAAEALGDVVFVSLPEVGAQLAAEQACGEIESTKSVSDLYCPADGEVVEVNTALIEDPTGINSDPYGAGWLFRLRLGATGELLDAAAYVALTEQA